MLTETEILNVLDNYRNNYDPAFVELGHPYVFPIDSRINVFRNENDQWALAIEVLGYCTRSEPIGLDITYYGNCLVNLKDSEGNQSNSYCVLPVDENSFNETVEFEQLKQDAAYWLVRGQKLKLSHFKKDYEDAAIELKEYEPGEIRVEEAARLLVVKYGELFRATDDELYRSIPKNMKKILVIDEWHHRDFFQESVNVVSNLPFPVTTPEKLNEAFENQLEFFTEKNISKEEFVKLFDMTDYDEKINLANQKEWENNRPGSYETWQLIAKVLVTGDTSIYKPKLAPTSHWRNWPDAGSM